MVRCYRKLQELPLPVKSQLETIRLLGQDAYLRGQYVEANRIFAEAINLDLDLADSQYRNIVEEKLGNILYLRGLSFFKANDQQGARESFEKLINDPVVLGKLNPATALSVYDRLGNLHFDDNRFEEAHHAFVSGLALLEKTPEQEYGYRIRLEMGKAKAKTMAEEDPDRQRLLEQIDTLRKKYANGYPDFDDLLKLRVTTSKEMEDGHEYVHSLDAMREYYVKKFEFAKEWSGFEKDDYLNASGLLIKHHLDSDQEDQARSVFLQTCELANPPEYWMYRFPKSFVKKSLEKSVLDPKNAGK